ncbi:MAG: hypothetical protein U1E14_10065 [Geminicoccaceae bacterium]
MADGGTRTDRWIALWTGFVVVAIYMPVLCGLLASLSKSRYFAFPIKVWSLDWWNRTAESLEIGILVRTSLVLALCVTVLAVVLGFFGALAFARYDWRGRTLFQRLVLLPIFFPQPVLGWPCCCGSTRSACRCRGTPRSSRTSSGSRRW